MTATLEAPPAQSFDRSVEQRMEALERATQIRVHRAGLKRDIKAGRVSALAILRGDVPAELASMKVWDLLMAMPKIGRVKANRVFVQCRISPAKTVGGMTGRQRGELVQVLEGRRS